MVNVTVDDWFELKEKYPPEFETLIDSAIESKRLLNKLLSLNTKTFPGEWKEYILKTLSVIREYKKLMFDKLEEVDKGDATEDIDKDIEITTSIFYDNNGKLNLNEIMDQMRIYKDNGKLDIFVSNKIVPIEHFINNIFDSLKDGIKNYEEGVYNKFVISASKKAGIFKEFEMKKDEFGFEPPEGEMND